MKYYIFILYILCLLGPYHTGVSGEENDEEEWNPSKDECQSGNECEPTTHEAQNVNVKHDTIALHEALTTKNVVNVMNIVLKRSRSQRLDLVHKYYDIYGETLFSLIGKNLVNSNFRGLIIASLRPLDFLYATELKNIISESLFSIKDTTRKIKNLLPTGSDTISEMTEKFKSPWEGSSYTKIVEILGALSNKGVKAVADNYYNRFGMTLSKALKIERAQAETKEIKTPDANDPQVLPNAKANKKLKSPKVTKDPKPTVKESVQQFLQHLIVGSKNEESESTYSVEDDVKELVNAKENKIVMKMSDMVFSRNTQHLQELSNAYHASTKHSLDEILRKSTEKDLASDVITLLNIRKNRAAFYAKQLKENFDRPLFDYKTIADILVSRSEIDLLAIKKAFDDLKGVSSLAAKIRNKLSKDEFQAALLVLIGEQ